MLRKSYRGTAMSLFSIRGTSLQKGLRDRLLQRRRRPPPWYLHAAADGYRNPPDDPILERAEPATDAAMIPSSPGTHMANE
jgi:hypothetical protein